jgi:hypothetical protein
MNNIDENKKARREERRGESIALPAHLRLVLIPRLLDEDEFGIEMSARRTPRTIHEHRQT